MDFACSCSNTAFLATLQSEIASVCSPADYAGILLFYLFLYNRINKTDRVVAALAMASSTCRSAGVTISLAPATTGTTAVTAAVLAPMTPATSAGSPQVSTFAAVDSDTSGSTSTGIYSQTYSGQLQSATGVSNIASNLTNSSSIVPFTGSASSFQVQGISVGVLIGAVGVFFAFQ